MSNKKFDPHKIKHNVKDKWRTLSDLDQATFVIKSEKMSMFLDTQRRTEEVLAQ